MVEIREERPGDEAGIRQVNERAFETSWEADAVDALRRQGVVTLSLVAGEQGRIVGHIMFSPVTVVQGSSVHELQGLAPMAVDPPVQGRGIGSALVREGLARLVRAGHHAVVVVGHPGFYPRFGFERASLRSIRFAGEVPDEAFMAVELTQGALEGVSGVARYLPVFEEESSG